MIMRIFGGGREGGGGGLLLLILLPWLFALYHIQTAICALSWVILYTRIQKIHSLVALIIINVLYRRIMLYQHTHSVKLLHNRMAFLGFYRKIWSQDKTKSEL